MRKIFFKHKRYEMNLLIKQLVNWLWRMVEISTENMWKDTPDEEKSEKTMEWTQKWKGCVCSMVNDTITLVYSMSTLMLVTEMAWTPMLEPYLQRAERPCKKEGFHLKGYTSHWLVLGRSSESEFLSNTQHRQKERKTMLLHSLFLFCCLFSFAFPIILLLHYYSFCPSLKKCKIKLKIWNPWFGNRKTKWKC